MMGQFLVGRLVPFLEAAALPQAPPHVLPEIHSLDHLRFLEEILTAAGLVDSLERIPHTAIVIHVDRVIRG